MELQQVHKNDTNTGLDWLVIAYVILLPMQFSMPFEMRLAPSDLCMALYVMFSLFRMRIVKSSWGVWHYLMPLVFMTGTAVALFENGSVSSYAWLSKDFGLLMLLFGYWMITSYASSWERVRTLVRCLIGSTVVLNVAAIAAFGVEKLSGLRMAWINYEGVRLSGMLVDPNAYGGLLVLVFALHVMTSGKHNPLFSGWVSTFFTVTLGIGIVLTFSRSAWIGLAMIIVGVAVFRPVYILRLLAVGTVSGAAIFLVFGSGYVDVISQMATRQSQITSRMDYIYAALERYAESPLLGVGVGTFHVQYDWIVHNTTVWFLTEFGLLGLVTLLGFLCWFLVRGWAAYRLGDQTQRWLIFGLLLAHVAMYGLSMGIEAMYQRHWWLVMALLATSYSLVKKEGGSRQWTTSSNLKTS